MSRARPSFPGEQGWTEEWPSDAETEHDTLGNEEMENATRN